MPKILAIDSSSAKTKVALCSDGQVAEIVNEEPRQAAQTLLPLIQCVLENGNTTLPELDAITVVTGPGSFTGLRIGIGVAQGLSAANETPLIGVSSLELFAQAASKLSEHKAFLVCLPAREHEVYFAGYALDREGSAKLVPAVPEQVLNFNNADIAPNRLGEQAWVGAGQGWSDQSCRQKLESLFGIQLIDCFPDIEPSMTNLWEISRTKLSRQELVDAEQLLPNYVKEQLDYLS